jgi:hypothetical protein
MDNSQLGILSAFIRVISEIRGRILFIAVVSSEKRVFSGPERT